MNLLIHGVVLSCKNFGKRLSATTLAASLIGASVVICAVVLLYKIALPAKHQNSLSFASVSSKGNAYGSGIISVASKKVNWQAEIPEESSGAGQLIISDDNNQDDWPSSGYSAFNYKNPGRVWEGNKSMGAGENYPGIDKNADSNYAWDQGVSGPKTSLSFAIPVKNPRVTSFFGWRKVFGRIHYGIDFGDKKGTSIYASERGTVTWYTQMNSTGGFGNVVEINHGDGFTTIYGHCGKLYVQEGDHVEKGDLIATVSNSGLPGAGPHLHFEIRQSGVPYNPFLGYLDRP